ncbi:uncharacterized protein PgNI_09485 [Pyricularia grisea]|uniref:Uncharacterized protein n=1 Tax=Pyricularia grisea TaxID=148305 RepID=A0A6P8AT91_PYRGI|nr:uncharacterized protein PgNI_09485 [Pyricularia grisea]TLD05349.1 hypothetical protein PgNI_09485 [Pyricularia grisea]
MPLLQKDAEGDLQSMLAKCGGGTGVLDPLQDFYRLIFKLSIRTVGAMEIADSPKLFNDFITSLQAIAGTASAWAVIFPSFPILTQIRNIKAGMKLYKIISSIREERLRTGKREEDAMQMLMDDDTDNGKILKFILGSLFAAVLNTVLVTAYIFVYLATNPEWYKRVQQEVDDMVKKHRLPGQTSFEAIRRLTFLQLVHQFPIIDACIKETIRFQMPTAGFRQNVSGTDIPIGNTGEIIPRDAYAVEFNPKMFAFR